MGHGVVIVCLPCVVLFGLMTTRLNKHYYYYYYYYYYNYIFGWRRESCFSSIVDKMSIDRPYYMHV